MSLERHYSIESAAELLDLKAHTVRRATLKKPGERGYLRSVKMGETRQATRRIPESALIEWLRSDEPEPSVAPVVNLDERRTHGKPS